MRDTEEKREEPEGPEDEREATGCVDFGEKRRRRRFKATVITCLFVYTAIRRRRLHLVERAVRNCQWNGVMDVVSHAMLNVAVNVSALHRHWRAGR